jgi:phosphohistidine phosphatase SixA
MRRLMLLRHAKTETDAPSGRDRDRRLDHRGRVDAAEIGGFIGRHPPFPVTVLVSNAVRAHQTWDVAFEAMKKLGPKPQVEILPELYGADPSRLLEIIHEASAADPKVLLLVGHNPGMHELQRRRRRAQGARRQFADLGSCRVRLCRRRLGRRGIPSRAARAVCHPKIVEANVGGLSPRARRSIYARLKSDTEA